MSANNFCLDMENGVQEGCVMLVGSSYINGSRTANAFNLYTKVEDGYNMLFYASRGISAGEQVFINYDLEDCRCPTCRSGVSCETVGPTPAEFDIMLRLTNLHFPNGFFARMTAGMSRFASA
jgi:hypothetical protein